MKSYEGQDKNKIFEDLKSTKISGSDLKKAENKAGNLGSIASDFLTLISMVKDYFAGNFSIPLTDLAIIIGAILYVVLPLDAIPDIIPGLGFTDDIAVVGLALGKVGSLVRQYKNK